MSRGLLSQMDLCLCTSSVPKAAVAWVSHLTEQGRVYNDGAAGAF